MAFFPGTIIDVVRRYNRPSPNRKAFLELFILENGSYTDVHQVCSVHVFPRKSFTKDGFDAHYFQDDITRLVASGHASSVDFIFSGDTSLNLTPTLGVSAFTEYADTAEAASSVFRMGVGRYGVVLTPGSSFVHPTSGETENLASSIGDYFDVWTIKTTSDSSAAIFIEEFNLAESTFFHLTEPLQIKANNKLKTNRVRLGAKETLLIGTDISILNRDISTEVKSSLGKSIIDAAKVRIVRYNNQGDLPNFVEVSSFADTSSSVHVDSSDTISLLFDTNLLQEVQNLDSRKGVYHVQVSFDLFDQTLLSDEFPLIVE